MAIACAPQTSLRLERAESSRLAWAFAVSLILHISAFGTYELGKKLHWWENIHLPAWLEHTKLLTELLQKKEVQPPPEPKREIPLVFVDVSPAQVTPDPPKQSEFYSDKNSKAANPEPTKEDAPLPKIDGEQIKIVKTEDVPRAETHPLQPAPPPPQPLQPAQPKEETKETAEPKEEPKPKPTMTPGDLALAKPDVIQRKDPGEAPRERPRTIAEALARQPNSQLAGQKMKQDGGVKRRAVVSSLDTVATPFGAYDAAIIAAVQNRWYYLLDNRNYASDQRGVVTIKFRLHSDGSVTEISLVEHSVDLALSLLCQSAIADTAPYAKWPSDMRRLVGADFREVTFTFFYN
jgi:outer membrane biosynthesis protein TonB